LVFFGNLIGRNEWAGQSGPPDPGADADIDPGQQPGVRLRRAGAARWWWFGYRSTQLRYGSTQLRYRSTWFHCPSSWFG
jgi:hypothetical protein